MKNLNEEIERINRLSHYQVGVVINEQKPLNVDSLYYIVKDVLSKNEINQTPNKDIEGNSVTVLDRLPALYVSIYPSTDEEGKYTIKVSGEKREELFKPQTNTTTNSGEKFIPPQTITRKNSRIWYDVSPDNLKSELGKLVSRVKEIL